MPIEIKITDIRNLTLSDIETLTGYLKASIPPCGDTPIEKPIKRKKQSIKIEPELPNILPAVVPEETDVTYEDVVGFVLECTRTKKLNFDKVMAVLSPFDIPNLNALEQHPEHVISVYAKLKEIVNE